MSRLFSIIAAFITVPSVSWAESYEKLIAATSTTFEAATNTPGEIFGSEGPLLMGVATTILIAVTVLTIVGAKIQAASTVSLDEIETIIGEDDINV